MEKPDLSRLIHSLQSSKSPGPDEIGVALIKEVSSIIVQPPAFIFNLSITNDVFPEQLKIAKVIPAYKKGDACLASNYRPILLLSVFDKLLEKLMCMHLYSHLEII